jgi:bacteriorhodopsin
VRAAVVKALASRRRSSEDTLWVWVMVGLMVLAALALGGLLFLIGDGNPATQPELALAAFVGLLGGLLGLLTGAPWREQSG